MTHTVAAAPLELVQPALKERLWHEMRTDLQRYIPAIANEPLLMCCACGRFLRFEEFDVEHIIPRQALNNDPKAARENPATPKNVRAGTTLLCKKRLRYKNSKFYDNGCNSWKGRFYDKPITEVLSGSIQNRQMNTNHILSALIVGYMAMVAEYGYRVSLTQSGVLLRNQFFRPGKYYQKLGSRHQIMLAGAPIEEATHSVWSKPFSFSFENGSCYATIRNVVIILPVDGDPTSPIFKNIPFLPNRYAFLPDFRTHFE